MDPWSVFESDFFKDDDDKSSRSSDFFASESDSSPKNESLFGGSIFKRAKRNNSYFQEELDDNLPDDYVINGWGSLDDDE